MGGKKVKDCTPSNRIRNSIATTTGIRIETAIIKFLYLKSFAFKDSFFILIFRLIVFLYQLKADLLLVLHHLLDQSPYNKQWDCHNYRGEIE